MEQALDRYNTDITVMLTGCLVTGIDATTPLATLSSIAKQSQTSPTIEVVHGVSVCLPWYHYAIWAFESNLRLSAIM